jgi:hypothetical protein
MPDMPTGEAVEKYIEQYGVLLSPDETQEIVSAFGDLQKLVERVRARDSVLTAKTLPPTNQSGNDDDRPT